MKILAYLCGFIALVLFGTGYYALSLIFGQIVGIGVAIGLLLVFMLWQRLIFD